MSKQDNTTAIVVNINEAEETAQAAPAPEPTAEVDLDATYDEKLPEQPAPVEAHPKLKKRRRAILT